MKSQGSSRQRAGHDRRRGADVPKRTLDTFVDEHVAFLGSFLRGPASVGAVVPSSPALARAMIAGCNLAQAETVVELGPGTGSFTELILKEIGRRTTFLALELDEPHVKRLRRKFPHAAVYHDTAANLAHYLALHGKKRADYVISGLPWASIPKQAREMIMAAILECLAPGGVFTTFGYLHTRLLPRTRKFCMQLRKDFASVERSKLVWRNIPPAFVYRCTRAL